MHVTETGWLESADHRIEQIPTTRTCSLVTGKPSGVVSHWTGSRGKTDQHSRNLATSVAAGRGSSWHLLIARSGLIVQSAPLTIGTHHCRGRAVIGEHDGPVNELTIGIEIENAGALWALGDGFVGVNNPHEPDDLWQPGPYSVPESEAVDVDGLLYHAYSDAQVHGFESVLRALVEWHPSLTAETCLYGHIDLDPDRKADPGPLWLGEHLPGILRRVFGGLSCR